MNGGVGDGFTGQRPLLDQLPPHIRRGQSRHQGEHDQPRCRHCCNSRDELPGTRVTNRSQASATTPPVVYQSAQATDRDNQEGHTPNPGEQRRLRPPVWMQAGAALYLGGWS